MDNQEIHNWMELLTERERKEVKFAWAYAANFNHGTDGHSRLLLIAKLADLLIASQVKSNE